MNTETLRVIRGNLDGEIKKGLSILRGYEINSMSIDEYLETSHKKTYEEEKLHDILMLVLLADDLVMATLLEDYARTTGEETGEIALGKLIEGLSVRRESWEKEYAVFEDSYRRVLRRLVLEGKM